MVTRTTDIDHPDRNCVSRVCDRCEVVFFRIHSEDEDILDLAWKTQHRGCVAARSKGDDLCRKCKEKSDADQKA